MQGSSSSCLPDSFISSWFEILSLMSFAGSFLFFSFSLLWQVVTARSVEVLMLLSWCRTLWWRRRWETLSLLLLRRVVEEYKCAGLRKLRRNGGWMEPASIRRTIRRSLELERYKKKRKIDRHVCKAAEKPVGKKNWSTCAQSCWETCWREKLINMCEKLLWNLLKRKIDQHACKESCWKSCWHKPNHVWWVAIYLFHGRTCCRSVRDVPIPSQNLLAECAWCTDSGAELPIGMCAMYLLYRRGALCTGFTLVQHIIWACATFTLTLSFALRKTQFIGFFLHDLQILFWTCKFWDIKLIRRVKRLEGENGQFRHNRAWNA